MRHALLALILLSTLVFAKIDEVVVAVDGDGPLARALEGNLSGFARILGGEDKRVFLDVMKECEYGLSECPEISKLPAVDFVIRINGGVRIYDIGRRMVDVLPDYLVGNAKAVVDYFREFVMYFHLPEFRDPTARVGDVYVLMDENFKDLKRCVLKERTEIVNLSGCAPKGALYARKIRRIVKLGNLEMELRKSDVRTLWVNTKGFEVYRDGQTVRVPVLLSKGGLLAVYDIYGGKAHLLTESYVESGEFDLSLEAYHDPSVEVEQLVFLLFDPRDRPGIPEVAGEGKFRDLLEKAVGIGVFYFTVKEGDR